MKGKKFAIRPFLGGVGGISGEAKTGNMTSLLRRMNSLTPQKDYVVLPNQKWLDGIATSPGIIKQFVAVETPTKTPKANPKLMGMIPVYPKVRKARRRRLVHLSSGKSSSKARLAVSSYK
jgi:hypothetical protein